MFLPNRKLEMAFLFFFNNFRKSYIGKYKLVIFNNIV